VLYFFEKQILLGILGDRPWCPLSSVKILERSLVGAQYTNDRHFDQKTRENDQDRFFCRYFRSFSESTKAFAWTHIYKTPLFEDIASKLLKNWKKIDFGQYRKLGSCFDFFGRKEWSDWAENFTWYLPHYY